MNQVFTMSKKNLTSIVFLIIIVIAVLAYFIYPKFAKTDADPWLMVPNNSALILQFDKPSVLFDKLSDGNAFWASATKAAELKRIELQIVKIDELFSENDSYSNLLKNSPLMLSFHVDETNKTASTLFLSQFNAQVSDSEIKSFLSRELGTKYAVAGLNEREFGGLKIIDAVNENTIYLIFLDGIMLASSDLNLISESYRTYKSKGSNLTNDKDFVDVKNTAGNKIDARMFVNYSNLSSLLKLFSSEEEMQAVDWISNFASWTEVDILLKNDEIIMTGFTSFNNDSLNYLSLMKDQLPQKSLVYNYCPFNTDILLRLAYSDFYSHFNSSNNGNPDTYSLPGLNYNLTELLKLIGSEVAYGTNASQVNEFNKNSFALVHLKDRQRAKTVLKDISKVSGGKKSSKFNGYSINQIKYDKFLSSLFGSAFSPIKNNYYLFIGDFVVFANSKDMLTSILQMYDTGKTIDLNDNFKKYSDNLSSKDNLSLFIKPRDLISLLPKFVNLEINKALLRDKESLRDIQGMSFQFSNDGPMAYTNFYIKLGKTYSEENLALWKIKFDDEIVGKPYLVRDHTTNKFMVLAFDKSSKLYLVSTDGQLLWKKRIDGLPQGDIHQVDFYKNGKVQYLFNTRDFIYLIDKKGNFVKNYPKKLNPASTNSLNVFDYNRKRDYRIILAQADKKIYNYNLNGSKVDGWKEPHTRNIVNESVKRLVANNKDYILLTDIDNKTTIVNRKGKERIKIKGDFKKARNSSFFVNRTNSKGIIITTNEKGKLTYIKASGKLDKTDFGDYTKDHFFLYEDFNDDKSVDFIFVDGRKLRVFDRFKKELFSYDFEYEINIKPMYFSLGKKQSVLGIVSSQEKTIYLFDNMGNTIISKGLVGETAFTVGSLNNNRELNLITAAGDMLYNYRLK